MTDIFFIFLWFSKKKHEEKQHYLGQPDPEEHQRISERFNNSRRVILKYLGPQLFLRIGKHMVQHNNSVLRFVCLFSKGLSEMVASCRMSMTCLKMNSKLVIHLGVIPRETGRPYMAVSQHYHNFLWNWFLLMAAWWEIFLKSSADHPWSRE